MSKHRRLVTTLIKVLFALNVQYVFAAKSVVLRDTAGNNPLLKELKTLTSNLGQDKFEVGFVCIT
jgi:hypothetical protein